MNNKLYFSGTKTATEFAGYMEGALISALKIVESISFEEKFDIQKK